VVAFVLIGLAAYRSYVAESEKTEDQTDRAVATPTTLIPLTLAFVAATTIIVSAVFGSEDDLLIITGATTLLLVIVRQMLAMVDRARLEDRLSHQALHDPLTQLPNRVLFQEHLDNAVARGKREGSGVAMVFVDLDDFKAINDVMGHLAGDELLCHVSRRFQASLREGDVIARTGGDEFAVLLAGVHAPEGVIATATRMLESLSVPFPLQHRAVNITASFGAAMVTGRDETGQQLLANADIAMYAAKRAGKGTVKIFEPSMHAQIQERVGLLEDLRRGVERDQFLLYYQPIISLRSDQIVGVEALLRWYHPARGLLAPPAFLAAAEESGLIVPIGWKVLRAATADAARWQRVRGSDAPLFVNVNISVRQLESPDFVEEVTEALERSRLDPHQLVLEITETVMVGEPDIVSAKLSTLRELGVRVAIDDFGAGYSSLRYLTQLPIDMIKIDRSFIQLLDRDTEDGQLAVAICKIGRTLGFEVVGEGIETIKQLQRLRRMDCDYGQGYKIARPLPNDELEMFLISDLGFASA
jgi:diguanylate cyclase (GGDEF)-like protein